MKTHTFSIVVGSAACNAKCPYCVSKMTRTAACRTQPINKRRFHTACRIVEQARDGLVSVLLTGKGEPLLAPDMITEYLSEMEEYRFPLIDLQTNGIRIDHCQNELMRWQDMGLTLVCLSVAHWDPTISNRLMGIEQEFNFCAAANRLHELGFAVRLNCTMLKSGLSTPVAFENMVTQCRKLDIEQLTLREVEMPELPENSIAAQKVVSYIEKEKPHGYAKRLCLWLEMNRATKLMELAHGAIIYDYHGQNVCISNCLTSTTDPDDLRQIIYFPDGRIMYDWKYAAARIL